MKLSHIALLTFFIPLFAARAEQRMNILFVFADDWGRYASAYAKADARPSLNDVIHTPNVDRVAKEGVLFRNAFVSAPSCTPSRSALFSGRHFFQTGQGAILIGGKWDSAIPSFPLMLQESGYHLGKTYKAWGPGSPADGAIGGQRFAYEKAGYLPNHFSLEVTKMMAQGVSLADGRDKVLGQVRDNFDMFLKDAKPGQPWLYYFGPTTTHRTWAKGSGKALWGIEPERLKDVMPGFLPDVPEVREDVADYLGECQAVDAYLGVLLKRLEETGQLEHTVIVLSGDHGMPGVPNGKGNVYDHGSAVPLVIRMPGTPSGRVVDDLVRLPDLAPTFLEIGGVQAPTDLYGQSLVPLLKSERSGQVDPSRKSVIIGRERHVDTARPDNLPYPIRALRTNEHLYIRNFEPERWPMGDSRGISESNTPTQEALENDTRVAFQDMDSGPTKAWLVMHRSDGAGASFYQRAFGKRAAEELYDLKTDPNQLRNVAEDPAYSAQKARLSSVLLSELKSANDPRLADPVSYEHPPFTDLAAPRGSKRVR